ncbi:MAG: ATP-grasp domain-containing protein [Candidatus Levybacteria bacterium]|nr:ATP-grasp domain-containing protein [Candidatus Levybacteria bacterium]
MLKQKRILLLGCGGSAGINFVKALRLAREKLYIVGIDKNKYYLELSPANKRYLVDHKPGEEKEYINKIIKIIKKEKIDFVHAQPDPEVKILSDYREQIPVNTFLPSKSAVDISQDKWKTYEQLRKHNVPVADTIQVKNVESLKKKFQNNREVLWIRASRGAGGKASLPVKSFEQAKVWIEYWLERGLEWSDFLVNEYLPGKEVSWLSIWKNGKLICSQQKERVEWVQAGISPSGVTGTTAIQKTVQYPNVNQICTAAVLAVDNDPNGIFVVDVKENKRGIPCVTEINPGRFFTTSLFFATAGINMPKIFVDLGLNSKIKKIKKYNSVPSNVYWIRVTDGGPVMIKNNSWTSQKI